MRLTPVFRTAAILACSMGVPVALAATTPSLAPVDSKDHVRGSADAVVTIVEYADLQCPFCARAHDTMETVLRTYEGKVRLVLRHFPLSFHQHAYTAAAASECIAAAKGDAAFWAFVEKYYDDQTADPVQLAADMGYDVEACIDMTAIDDRIQRDIESGDAAGVSGTPMFFIVDGATQRTVSVSGAQEARAFTAVIDDMLEGAGEQQPPAPTLTVETPPDSTKPIRAYSSRTEYLRGRPTARFVVVEYGNFSETFTPKLHAELKRLLAGRTDTAWVMRSADLPFVDRNGLVQSQAALCAGRQKKAAGFWRMADIILAKHRLAPETKMTAKDLQSLAERLGYDGTLFSECMRSTTVKAQVEADVREAAERYDGVPTAVVIDTRTKRQEVVQGAYPANHFEAIIEDILAKDTQ